MMSNEGFARLKKYGSTLDDDNVRLLCERIADYPEIIEAVKRLGDERISPDALRRAARLRTPEGYAYFATVRELMRRLANHMEAMAPYEYDASSGAVDEEELVNTLEARVTALRSVLDVREKELFDLKGSCSSSRCTLYFAHSGPCNIPKETS